MEVTLKVIRNDSGEPISMFVSIRDLAHMRRIDERLKLSASVFEHTTQGVVITDARGVVLEVNPAFSEILGYSREEVIGKTPSLWRSRQHEQGFFREMWQR